MYVYARVTGGRAKGIRGMASEIIQYRVCDRCGAGEREVLAEVTDKLILNGHRFDIDLCRDCSAELYSLVMHTWGSLGVKVGEPGLLDAARPISTKPAARLPEATRPTLTVVHSPVAELPETAKRWQLSPHAEQRMHERGFSIRDILWAAEQPEKILPHPKRQDVEYHWRGACCALVSKFDPIVVTVLHPHDMNQKVEA